MDKEFEIPEEFDSPDEWQLTAERCQQLLTETGIKARLAEEGILDEFPTGEWEIFREYDRLIPAYAFPLEEHKDAELSLCLTHMTMRRMNIYFPAIAYAPHFNEVQGMVSDISSARLFAITQLPNDPGYVYIEPMNLEGAISKLFEKVSLQIEGFDEFNALYRFDAQDPAAAEEVLTPYFFKLVRERGDLHIEIKDSWLVASYLSAFTEDQVAALGSLISALAEPKG